MVKSQILSKFVVKSRFLSTFVIKLIFLGGAVSGTMAEAVGWSAAC